MCWSSAAAGVQSHPEFLHSSDTATFCGLWASQIKFHLNCIEQNVHATTIHIKYNFTNTDSGHVILSITFVSFTNSKFHIWSPVDLGKKKTTKNISYTIPEQRFLCTVKYSTLLLHFLIVSLFKLHINSCFEILQSWRSGRHNER